VSSGRKKDADVTETLLPGSMSPISSTPLDGADVYMPAPLPSASAKVGRPPRPLASVIDKEVVADMKTLLLPPKKPQKQGSKRTPSQ
jgi:hypothetical protein